jgi:hypothetical protein
MRQISQIADRLLSMVVPAAEAKASGCGCSYTGLMDEDPSCPNGYIYQMNCPNYPCTKPNYVWQCEL